MERNVELVEWHIELLNLYSELVEPNANEYT